MEKIIAQEEEIYENLLDLIGETELLLCALQAQEQGALFCAGSAEARRILFRRMENHIVQYTQDICAITRRLIQSVAAVE